MEDDLATIFERIRKITVDQLGISEEEVTPSSSFVDDLGADSLDMVELIMALEEDFTTPVRKVSIPDEDVEKIITVQDAMDYIRDKGATDNELPKTAEKAIPKPAPRPTTPTRPEPHKPNPQAKPGPGVRPSPQAKGGQNRPNQNRPGGQRHQGQPPRRPQQPPKPSGGQQPPN